MTGGTRHGTIAGPDKDFAMPVRMILACSANRLLTRLAAAQECQHMGYEDREAMIRKAPTCDKAMGQFGDCAFGASGDTGLGQIVTEKCEGDFLKKLSAGQKRTYQREIKRCNDKYAKMEGSMYVAMAAGCRAELARTFSHKYSKARSR